MGSIFGNSTAPAKRYTSRQRKYFDARKTERPRVVKHEQKEQIAICDWMREVLPGIHFRCDTGSGGFSSAYEKATHNKQQSSPSEPDIMIFSARKGYHALLIELKATGTELKMRRDGRAVRVTKDKQGRVVERDYKIRKKGDWASLHIEKQAHVLEDYRKQGYFATFAIGEDQAKEIISRYFDLPINESLF